MKKFQYLILLNAMCIVLSACNKIHVEPSLPAETQIGAKTFGCKVNGKVWVADAPFPISRLTNYYYNGVIGVRATLKTKDICQTIYICRDSVYKPGTYLINNYLQHKEGELCDLNSQCCYDTDSVNIGYLEMTRVDTINGIFSGRFRFKITVPDCGTVDVTEGRFDVRR